MHDRITRYIDGAGEVYTVHKSLVVTSLAVVCAEALVDETIVRAFTNLCLLSIFDSRDTRWLSHRLHITLNYSSAIIKIN